MEEMKAASVGSFCWNKECADYGKVGQGNIIKNGKTDKGVQRYRCKTCKKIFTQTKGAIHNSFPSTSVTTVATEGTFLALATREWIIKLVDTTIEHMQSDGR